MRFESDIEEYLTKCVKNLGGLSLKFVSPGTRGVPDRIVLFSGRVYFIELKTMNGIPSKIQKYMHRQFRRRDIDVYIISSHLEVDDFVVHLREERDRLGY